VKDDKLYRNERRRRQRAELSKDDHDRIRRLTGIRDTVNDLLDAQLKPGTADTEALRKKLRAAYDAFVRAHGPINRETRTVTARIGADGEPIVITRVPNFAKFRPDPDAWKVAAIERYDAETDTAKPADIQTKDVIDAPRDARSTVQPMRSPPRSMPRVRSISTTSPKASVSIATRPWCTRSAIWSSSIPMGANGRPPTAICPATSSRSSRMPERSRGTTRPISATSRRWRRCSRCR
jgi:hypothetical protein